MRPVYPKRRIYIDDDRDGIAETDITVRVVSDIDLLDGFRDARSTNRIPPSGTIRFQLENSDGYYERAVQLLGKSISFCLVFAGDEQQIFWGYVTDAGIDSGPIKPLRIPIVVNDWLDTANKTRVKDLDILTNKRADEALPFVLGILAVPPLYAQKLPVSDPDYNTEISGTDFDIGTETFENIFDGARGKNTKVFQEMDRIIKSELGRLFLLHGRGRQGVVLRMENKYARGSTRALARAPIHRMNPSRLAYHGPGGASGQILYHGPGGTAGAILVHETREASFNSHFDAGWTDGNMVVNDYSITIIPRATVEDTIVYNLGTPIEFGAGERKRVTFFYSNPEGGSILGAKNVTVTDYAFNSERDGSGTDLTANFVFLPFPSANSLRLHAENLGEAGYLTVLELTGTGIYKYNAIEVSDSNEESKVFMRTEISESLNREYSSDLTSSFQFARSEIALRRMPTRDINWAAYHANDDEARLLAFMYLGIGDKIRIPSSSPAHIGDYYIQGRKAKITMGGLVDWTWYLEEDPRTLCTPIAVKTTEINAGKRHAIDFGILSYLSNLPQFTYSLWVKRLSSNTFAVLMSHSVDTGTGRRGNFFLMNTNGELYFASYKTPTDGIWDTAPAVTTVGSWVHVCLTYDNGSADADPEIWVGGVKQTIAEISTPVGSTDDDSDCPLVLFNLPAVPGTTDLYYYDILHDVAEKDQRIYGRRLTDSEIAELAAGEDVLDNVQDGLLFQGIYAPKDNIDDYVGHTLEADDLVLDVVHRAAGAPYNLDTTDATTMLTGESI